MTKENTDHNIIWIKKIHLRNPFKIKHLPLLTRIYCFALNNVGNNTKKTFLLGFPSLFLFAFFQRLSPFKNIGTFTFTTEKMKKTIFFNAYNTQFRALYWPESLIGYEPEVMALLDILMPEKGVFYDIGSNWGIYSLFIASKKGFKGKIYAFEPFPSSYDDLKNIVSQAHLTNLITYYPFALSNKDGKTSMNMSGLVDSGSAMITNNPNGNIGMFKLDSLSLKPPSIIKIDVEGGEADVLIGAKGNIAKYTPMIIFENWRNFGDVNQTLKPLIILKNLGYVFFHPCWMKKKDDISYFASPEIRTQVSSTDILVLTPLSIEDRFLRHDQINIIACHKNNLNIISKSFTIYKKHE